MKTNNIIVFIIILHFEIFILNFYTFIWQDAIRINNSYLDFNGNKDKFDLF